MKPVAAIVGVIGLFAGAAYAYPDGAPWGAFSPDGAQSCSTCHFDYEAENDSALISISGLPEVAAPGETYELTLSFAPSGAVVAGFMLSATGGAFHHAKKGTEANEQDVRSTAPVPAQDGASWTMTWTAPSAHKGEIVFYAAVNGANDDMSAFGDRVYFRNFVVPLSD